MHVRELQEISVPELDKYIIIDTHGGVEDVLGIAVALKLAERYDKIILGITCVNGRRTVDQAVHDALVAQQIVGTKIPVYRGTSSLI
jgi:inosine-uridine nucleoside N-ribohydrolase